MSYISFENGEIKCSHPLVKEIKQYGSMSAVKDAEAYYNIKFTDNNGVEYRETGTSPKSVIESVERVLSKLQ